MKIALFVDSFLPVLGGRELVVHHLAMQFKAMGHQPYVIGAGGLWSKRQYTYPYPVIRCPTIPGFSEEKLKAILLRCLHAKYKFDLIHAHSTYPSGYIAASWLNRLRVPLVITPHGEDINVVPDLGFGYRLDPSLSAKISSALSKANRITAISNTVHQSILDAGADPKLIVDIANGVETTRFACASSPAIPTFGIQEEHLVAVSIGNYHPRKGHDIAIQAAAEILRERPEFRLVIVGGNTEKLSPFLTTEILRKSVILAGTIPTPDPSRPEQEDPLAQLLARSDIYISASVGDGAEGLSLALLEAMAARSCPVVTDISGNRDVIRSGENGLLVKSGVSADLTTAVLQLGKNKQLRQSLAETAWTDAQQFDWSKIAEDYLDCYLQAGA